MPHVTKSVLPFPGGFNVPYAPSVSTATTPHPSLLKLPVPTLEGATFLIKLFVETIQVGLKDVLPPAPVCSAMAVIIPSTLGAGTALTVNTVGVLDWDPCRLVASRLYVPESVIWIFE